MAKRSSTSYARSVSLAVTCVGLCALLCAPGFVHNRKCGIAWPLSKSARGRFRQIRESCAAQRCLYAYAHALDPGREELSGEWGGRGELVQRIPLQHGDALRVTRHAASEQVHPDSVPACVKQEWRVLHFESALDKVQSVAKVCINTTDHSERQRGDVIALGYVKSLLSVALATLAALGKPVVQPLTKTSPLRILCIGLGGGTTSTFLVEMLPRCHVDVAELLPEVVHAASTSMGFAQSARLQVAADNGATFAVRTVEEAEPDFRKGAYDAILVDAFTSEGDVPQELWQPGGGLAQALRQGLLSEAGVLAVNFLAGSDLCPAMAAYRDAISKTRGETALSFSIQTLPVAEEPADELDELFGVGEGTGNLIGVVAHAELANFEQEGLAKCLASAADQVRAATRCPFDMAELAVRGLHLY